MISTSDFHNGLTIELEGSVYTIIDFQHSKMGRGGALVKTKLKNVEDGFVIEKTFRAGEKFARAHVEQRKMQYLYWDGDGYVFMDNDNYEQITLTAEQLGDKVNYLKENMVFDIAMYKGKPIDINLPTFVELEVAETQPGIKGDTVSGGSKPATMDTGLVIQVPLFINAGDVLKIDTRTNEYIGRA